VIYDLNHPIALIDVLDSDHRHPAILIFEDKRRAPHHHPQLAAGNGRQFRGTASIYGGGQEGAKFYRLKEGVTFDVLEYSREMGQFSCDLFDEITEAEFEEEWLNGSGKCISYGASREQLEAIMRRRENKLLSVPPNI
jgi:hypothetical protein